MVSLWECLNQTGKTVVVIMGIMFAISVLTLIILDFLPDKRQITNIENQQQ